jgi:DNA-binding transcriptional LysR family regulator
MTRSIMSIYNNSMKSFRQNLTVDLRRLRVLRELQVRATIMATAKALHLTPSAISQQIAALSRDLGVPLLAPHGRGVRLTPQATVLLEHAALVDAQLERARADLAAMEQGSLGLCRIGAFATAVSGLTVPAVIRLRQRTPGIRVSIEEIEAPECFTQLDRGDLELVITVDYRTGPHRSDVRYHRQDLLDDPLLVAVTQRHPLARRSSIDLRALADDCWIVGAMHGPCLEAGAAALAAAGFNPAIAHRVNDWSALLRLVEAGCGVGLIPQLAVDARVLRGVVVRPPAGESRPSRHIYAAVRAGAERSPLIAAVLSALGTVARERTIEASQRGARR